MTQEDRWAFLSPSLRSSRILTLDSSCQCVSTAPKRKHDPKAPTFLRSPQEKDEEVGAKSQQNQAMSRSHISSQGSKDVGRTWGVHLVFDLSATLRFLVPVFAGGCAFAFKEPVDSNLHNSGVLHGDHKRFSSVAHRTQNLGTLCPPVWSKDQESSYFPFFKMIFSCLHFVLVSILKIILSS